MKQTLLLISIACTCTVLQAQTPSSEMTNDTLPYYEIPAAPQTYTAANVAARTIDGLGYRYYWATEDLRSEDLAYNPGNDGKTCEEVLEHLAGLSNFILTAVMQQTNGTRKVPEDMTWTERRAYTLSNFKTISDILRETGDVEPLKIVFKRDDQTSEFPFWNLINGPIADAIYHTGQIVSYRRSAGNPSNPNVNVFRGKTKE